MMQTIVEIRRALDAGTTTSQALVEEMLLAATDPAGEGKRAFRKLYASEALAQAMAFDACRKAGVPAGHLGPLAGIPISVKDLFDIAGEVTTAGSVVLADNPPAARDAPAIERLRRAGAILIGRTNMTEWAYGAVGANGHFGTPRCAWDRAVDDGAGRIPGGSTSGGAISVTDGMAAATIGSDTGGSVRIPAALNGLAGFKPTARRVPLEGAYPLSQLDSIGPLAKSVGDCVLLDAIMAGGEGAATLPALPLRGLRLGISRKQLQYGLDREIAQPYELALSRLSAAGAQLIDFTWSELDEYPALNAKGGFSASECFTRHRAVLASRSAEIDPWIVVRVGPGAQQTAADYIELLAARRDWIARSEKKFAQFDAVIAPTVPVVAPRIKPIMDDVATLGEYFKANSAVLRNCQYINFLDGCGLTLPIHDAGRAPAGLMIAGAAMSDARILAIGLAVEAHLRAG
ncbi:MAG: amidase [Betaproteobacteria bacterium]|nr:amidase [Betaproteobacteria bacterium]